MARGADSAGYCQTDACHVPLPQIQNGERKAYALKSKELTGPTKGVIFLEIDVIFNAVSLSFAFDSPPGFFFLPPPTPLYPVSPSRSCSLQHPSPHIASVLPPPCFSSLVLVWALIIEDSLSAAFVCPLTISVCVLWQPSYSLLSLAPDTGHAGLYLHPLSQKNVKNNLVSLSPSSLLCFLNCCHFTFTVCCI